MALLQFVHCRMETGAVENSIEIGEHTVRLLIPDPALMQQHFIEGATDFPAWSKLWPASIALSLFLSKHLHLVRGKNVLELGCGLGLPALLIAPFANEVCATDLDANAVDLVRRSALLNRASNVDTRVLDWSTLSAGMNYDVVLMSDVNYMPAQFPTLFALITAMLEKRATIILSTPQRLMAKPFIKMLMPYCASHETHEVDGTAISIYILQPGDAGGL
jgi:predicted nicotinamide N-methyase